MTAHASFQPALNAHLRTLAVATTGSAALGMSALGFTRAAGSFLTDGFVEGMEVLPTGFPDNTRRVVAAVEALTLYTTEPLAVKAAAAGRSLAVGIPEGMVWDNKEFEPTAGRPYFEAEYLYGTSTQISSGPRAVIESEPLLVITINVPTDTGGLAAAAYLDKLYELFAPNTAILATGGHVLKVHGRPGARAGQLRPRDDRPGYSYLQLTIPLYVFTTNSI